MKMSLERINKAIKRYDKKNGSVNLPGPFELSHNDSWRSQVREHLESEGSSIYGGSVQVGSNPTSKILNKREISENFVDSINYNSEEQDIENFTLGPAQFKELRESTQLRKYPSIPNKIEERFSESKKNKRTMNKYSSADRIRTNKRRIFIKPEQNQLIMMQNNDEIQSPLVLVNPQNVFLNRQRGSAPNLEFNSNIEEFQRGSIIDKNYHLPPSSVRASPQQANFRNMLAQKQGKSSIGNQKYMGNFKINHKNERLSRSNTKRNIKVSNNKKFPSDFF